MCGTTRYAFASEMQGSRESSFTFRGGGLRSQPKKIIVGHLNFVGFVKSRKAIINP